MIERLSDASAEIQRVFLWQDIGHILRTNADRVGVNAPCLDESTCKQKPTRIVLSEKPDSVNDIIELWGTVNGQGLISSASLFYKSPIGQEIYSYELTPEGIAQYSPEPTELDDKDLLEMRADLEEAQWDPVHSAFVAQHYIFFE
jgi:hypothetical protein